MGTALGLLQALDALLDDAPILATLGALAQRGIHAACIAQTRLAHEQVRVDGVGCYDVVVAAEERVGQLPQGVLLTLQRIVHLAGAAEFACRAQRVVAALHAVDSLAHGGRLLHVCRVAVVELSATDVVVVALAEVCLIGHSGFGKEGEATGKAVHHELRHHRLLGDGRQRELSSLEVAVAQRVRLLLARACEQVQPSLLDTLNLTLYRDVSSLRHRGQYAQEHQCQ